jgi:hypothetical protein
MSSSKTRKGNAMAAATAPTGNEAEIRAIVFKEGDMYVGQCLEYDIAAQAPDLEALLDRLELTVEAEFATCAETGTTPHDCISPAPVYYHSLWEKRSVLLKQMHVSAPGRTLSFALAKAA